MSPKRRTVADEPFLAVRSSASNLAAGEVFSEHAHGWHQLVHARSGLLMVWTEGGSWVVPSRWAVWVPANVRHRIRAVRPSEFRTLYLAPAHCPDAAENCAVLAVTPLLRELVLKTVEIGMLDVRDAVEASTATLLAHEIRHAARPPFGLPEPRTAAMQRAVDRLFAGGPTGTAAIAHAIGLSPRTLERRFQAETGLSFGRWRRRGAMLAALEQLAAGASVKVVAGSAGYASASAFVAAFREAFGQTPGRYFAR